MAKIVAIIFTIIAIFSGIIAIIFFKDYQKQHHAAFIKLTFSDH